MGLLVNVFHLLELFRYCGIFLLSIFIILFSNVLIASKERFERYVLVVQTLACLPRVWKTLGSSPGPVKRDNQIGIYCFSAKHGALGARAKSG